MVTEVTRRFGRTTCSARIRCCAMSAPVRRDPSGLDTTAVWWSAAICAAYSSSAAPAVGARKGSTVRTGPSGDGVRRVAAMAWIVLPSTMRCIPQRGARATAGLRVADQPAPGRPAHPRRTPPRASRLLSPIVPPRRPRRILDDGWWSRNQSCCPAATVGQSGVPSRIRNRGAGAGIRTPDPRLKRPLLCH
jgi:hypothetical protein